MRSEEPVQEPVQGADAREVIAAFDFDGTLTTVDTLRMFTRRQRGGPRFLFDLIVTLPQLALYALGRVENDAHKMALFARAMGGQPAEQLDQAARTFARDEIPRILRPAALERLREHQQAGHRVLVITASPTDWVTPWAALQGITDVLGNRAEVVAGRVTGRLVGTNCHGPEKLARLLGAHPDRDSYVLYAYGNSRGDRELLGAADFPFYRRFR